VRVLLAGFDALDYRIVKKGFILPGFQTSPLHSPVPISGPAWTSLNTGDTMEKHGVEENFGRNVEGEKTYETTESAYMWDWLGDAGYTVKLVNVPITWPARPVNGAHVCGFPIIEKKPWFYPEGLMEDGYESRRQWMRVADMIYWYGDVDPWPDPMGFENVKHLPPEVRFNMVRRSSSMMIDFFLGLERADLEYIQFSFLDRLGHAAQKQDTWYHYYDLVREIALKLRVELQPDVMLVFGDHGMPDGVSHNNLSCLGLSGATAEVTEPEVMDLTPTVLDLFGVRGECEGSSVFDKTSYRKHEERVHQQRVLTTLGYFE